MSFSNSPKEKHLLSDQALWNQLFATNSECLAIVIVNIPDVVECYNWKINNLGSKSEWQFFHNSLLQCNQHVSDTY